MAIWVSHVGSPVCRRCVWLDPAYVSQFMREVEPCVVCHRPTLDFRYRRQKYLVCSQECRRVAYNVARRKRPIRRVCSYCYGSIAGKRADARFCSDAHRVAAFRARKRHVRDIEDRRRAQDQLLALVAATPGLTVWELQDRAKRMREFDSALRGLHDADRLACINGLWYVRTASVAEYEARFIKERRRSLNRRFEAPT